MVFLGVVVLRGIEESEKFKIWGVLNYTRIAPQLLVRNNQRGIGEGICDLLGGDALVREWPWIG